MTNWLSPNPFNQKRQQNPGEWLGWFLGYDYFVQVQGKARAQASHEYFSSRKEAFDWASRHKPSKIYRVTKGAEFHGEKGKSAWGNGVLVATIK